MESVTLPTPLLSRSRSEYTTQLINDLANYYGYSQYLCDKLFHLFTPSEVRSVEINRVAFITKGPKCVDSNSSASSFSPFYVGP